MNAVENEAMREMQLAGASRGQSGPVGASRGQSGRVAFAIYLYQMKSAK
jgi:hypothetical protein